MFGETYNAVDIAAVVVVLWGFLLGLRRGLSGELFRFLNVAITLLAGLRFYLPFGDLLIVNTRLSEHQELARAVAFLLIVITIGLCLMIVRMILHLVMKIIFTEKTNRVGGGFIGLARGVLFVILIVFAVGLWPHPYLRQVFVRQSFIGRTFFKVAPLAAETLNNNRSRGDWQGIGRVGKE